ncbi:hypothetical protein E3N88_01723 [Mikania micrantha]|uniref:Uncharacterized protein n=1 Tax=Mikania micrantha TaxID=192012 RepID=A0A5N6Q3I9_9ASTR|nr:hypothetical protein E3N88_01723 [Mikania micrantha]
MSIAKKAAHKDGWLATGFFAGRHAFRCRRSGPIDLPVRVSQIKWLLLPLVPPSSRFTCRVLKWRTLIKRRRQMMRKQASTEPADKPQTQTGPSEQPLKSPTAKDFGLARFQPEDQSHVSTKFAGTLKVYTCSFRIVNLEIVSGRRSTEVKSDTQSIDYLLEDASSRIDIFCIFFFC